MFASRTLAQVLFQLGLSRVSSVVLIAFFAAGLGLEHGLPEGEAIIQMPAGLLVVFSAAFFIIFGIRQEYRRVSLASSTYWRDLGYSLASFMLFGIFCLSFGPMKSLIPTFNPYTLDPLFQRIDMLLHGGSAPSLWFISLLNSDYVAMLNTVYLISWTTVIACYCLWQITSAPSLARSQFLSCFFLLWIIGGVVLATAFSSVGPIYYSLFYDDMYSAMNADFVTRLYQSTHNNAMAIDARNLLLDYLNDDSLTNDNGISAMPSLHTGMSILMAVHSYCYHRHLSWLMIPYAILIFLGSFILGWHYAIDTYVSAILLFLIWRLTRYDIRHQSAA